MTGSAPRFLAITGTTTSGKTALSLALAERLPIELVSMDSRQVYRGMDIGTDKVSDELRARVPHLGLDRVDPDQRYSAGQFARDVRRWVPEIEGRGALPVLVGGTGFFLKAVIEPIFAEPELDPDRLARLRSWLGERSNDELAAYVRALDPDRAAMAVEGGPQRMSRAIEVALLTGKPLSRWHVEAPAEAQGLPGVVVVLDLPREELYRRIDDRVTRMVDRGLVDEVRGLLADGYDDDSPGMTGTGYREVAAFLRDECSLEDALDQIRRNTRRYARRQITWFRHQLPEDAVRIDASDDLNEQCRVVREAMETRSLIASDGPGRRSSRTTVKDASNP